jgi:hypothetical protein
MLFPPCLVDKCICIYALIQESCIKQLNKLIGLDLQTYLHEISPRHSLKPSFPDGIPRKKTQVKINATVGETTTYAERSMGVLGATFEQGDDSHKGRRALVTTHNAITV